MAEIQEQNVSAVNQKVKIIFEGETVDADELGFKVESDLTLLCEVSDGAKIELRQTIKGVYRLCDKKKPDGTPIYVLLGRMETKQAPPPSKD